MYEQRRRSNSYNRHGADDFNERQADRDWHRRMSREDWEGDFPAECNDERYEKYRNTRKYPKSDHDGRHSGERDDWDRKNSYSNNSRGRDYRNDKDRRFHQGSRDSWRRREDRDSGNYDSEFDRTYRPYDRDGKESRHREHRSPDRDGDYHDRRDHGDSKGNERDAENEIPNNTIMVRGLTPNVTESDIQQSILQCGLMPVDIRLARKKDTGASRGFAFIEFNTLQEASQWMEMKQGILRIEGVHGSHTAEMHFSIPKQGFADYLKASNHHDWFCVKCGANNFKRRFICFKCQASRLESEEGQGCEEVSSHPTHTILLRNMDVLSTKESVLQALENFSFLSLKNIRIGKDVLTNTSRGVCYIELNSVLDSVCVFNALTAKPFMVDSKKVLVSYCKLPEISPPPGNADAGDATRRGTSGNVPQYGQEDIPRLAEYSASLYAKSPVEHVAYLQYYTKYYEDQLSQVGNASAQTPMDSVNAAAALAHSAIRQVQAAKEKKRQVAVTSLLKSDVASPGVTVQGEPTTSTPQPGPPPVMATSTTTQVPLVVVPTDASSLPKYSVPDVSTYQYDESSGYYYDPQTGLYYEAVSRFYFNPQTQQYLYWDSTNQTYMPYNNTNATSDAQQLQQQPQKEEEKKEKERSKEDKIKIAKKVAKDMEQWAKTLNQMKDLAKQNLASASSITPSGKSLGSADAGYAMLEKRERNPLNSWTTSLREPEESHNDVSPPLQFSGENMSRLVPAYGSESDEDIEDVMQEDKLHTDWSKLACLLCKRQFSKKEALTRHQQFSELHKQNLENWYHVRGLDPNNPQQRNNKYRDRAKERRNKFGLPNPPPPNRLKDIYLKAKEDAASISYEEPTKRGIGADNVGNKMLQKMGWKEGMGLGKSNQGSTTCIQTDPRMSTAGLGSTVSTFVPPPGSVYKDCVKKVMYNRFQELTRQEKKAES